MSTLALQRFQLHDIRYTGNVIGRGGYAIVKELDFRGTKCAGKEIHRLLYESAPPEKKADMLCRFEKECELLSQLDHPNVVKFLGVCSETGFGLPLLVMEYLPNGSLSNHLDRHGVLPQEISLGILRDVAFGLCYLHTHSPPIIHRDLTANNVLLTESLSAKISDLGVAKILNMSPQRAAQMTQTPVPGTPVYMPPEAMGTHPKYTHKIDIFSMGVLIMHVLSGDWPIPSYQDPSSQIVVTEFDRRRSAIEKIEDDHPLLSLIQQCLNNIPDQRPDAQEVYYQISGAMYYDFLLIGRTGMGKSTLGNTLLRVKDVDPSKLRLFINLASKAAHAGRSVASFTVGATTAAVTMGAAHFTSIIAKAIRYLVPPVDEQESKHAVHDTPPAESLPDEQEMSKRFITMDDYSLDDERRVHSVTRKCKLLANDEIGVRVLDVPGFYDSRTLSKDAEVLVSAYDGNLQTVRWIAKTQAENSLQVRRVVYFLPFRGVPEKADRILQDELQVMYHFFGVAIFNCMVVAATNRVKRRRKQDEFDDDDIEDTKKVFCTALKCAIKAEKIDCPPIIYIGIDDNDILTKLKQAPVLKEEVLELEFVEGVCSRCSVKYSILGQEKVVTDYRGRSIPYKDSKCHPCFVPKYTTVQKIMGGIGHIATLGTVYVASRLMGSTIWPGFTNADEKCPACTFSPGSPGCIQVEKSFELKIPNLPSETIVVHHTNKL